MWRSLFHLIGGATKRGCQKGDFLTDYVIRIFIALNLYRVRNLKFATYLKFATCENTNKINELW